MQIVRKRWRRFLPTMSLLNHDQKRIRIRLAQLVRSQTVAVAAAVLIWVPFVAFNVVPIPDHPWACPIIWHLIPCEPTKLMV